MSKTRYFLLKIGLIRLNLMVDLYFSEKFLVTLSKADVNSALHWILGNSTTRQHHVTLGTLFFAFFTSCAFYVHKPCEPLHKIYK